MAVSFTCDGPGCGAALDVTVAGWFGLDVYELDEDDEWTISEHGYTLYFCSPACLAAWAMDRAVHAA